MVVLLSFASIGCAAGVLLGLPTVYLLRLAGAQWWRFLYLAAVAASIVPYTLHYLDSLQYLARSGVDGYPGLDQFTMMVPAAAGVTVMAALLIAQVRPIVAALTPIMFGAIYWWLLIPMLYRKTPPLTVGLDNVALMWLFGFSFAGCAFLFVLSGFAKDRRDDSGTTETRAEQAAAEDAFKATRL